jgi:hypothetical protein
MKPYRVWAITMFAASALSACQTDEPVTAPITTSDKFIDMIAAKQDADDPYILSKPASGKYKPGTVIVVQAGPTGGQIRRAQGSFWDACAPTTKMKDWVKSNPMPSYTSNKGFNDAGLNLKATIDAFQPSATISASNSMDIKIDEMAELTLNAVVIAERRRTDKVFSDCMNNILNRPSVYMVAEGLALKKATFTFKGGAGANVTVPEAEINNIKAGGGADITWNNNGTLTYDSAGDLESVIVIAYKNVLDYYGSPRKPSADEDFAREVFALPEG